MALGGVRASVYGSGIGFGAFPLIAILVLHAGPAAVSMLAAAGLAAGAAKIAFGAASGAYLKAVVKPADLLGPSSGPARPASSSSSRSSLAWSPA